MTLVKKLKLINKPLIIPIQMGFAENSTELWNNFIFPRLPKKDVVLHWHKILTEYIKRSDSTFALTTAGYKIAHIYNVGTDYYSDGKFLSLSDIVEKYFPRGERTDWSERIDSYGKYFLRDLIVSDEAKNCRGILTFCSPVQLFSYAKNDRKKNASYLGLSRRLQRCGGIYSAS